MYNHFNQSDFQSNNCVPKCNIDDMDKDFMEKLDLARKYSGEEAEKHGDKCVYVITSAFRTVEHELSKGRNGSSAHTLRVSVDIRSISSRQRHYILYGLYKAGFHRIGINYNKKFIHVDDSTQHNPRVNFSY